MVSSEPISIKAASIRVRFRQSINLCTAALVLLLHPRIGEARLGETLEQTVKRYGDPIRKSKTGEVAMFKKLPYYITMHFWKGKADAMTYVRTKPNGEAAALSSHEIDSLLDLNSGDGNWKPVKEGSNTWKTDDAMREASYTKSDFLVITAATYSKHLSEHTTAEEPAKSARSKSTTSEPSPPSDRAKKSRQADESDHSTPKKHLAKESGSTKKPAGSNRESSEDESAHHRISKKYSSSEKKSQTDQEPAKSGRHKKSGNLTKNASSKDNSDQPAKKRHPSKGESQETGD